MKITIKQIAEEAGVSMTTVSNVINKRAKRVSEEKIDLIEQIIAKYNYTPNLNARSLAHSTSKLIGLLYFSDSQDFTFSDPFVAEVLSSVEKEAKNAGYFVLVHHICSEKELATIQQNWKFEGFIIVGVPSKIFFSINSVLKEPAVYIDTHLSEKDQQRIEEHTECAFVNSNDYQSGKLAAQYLLDNGHQSIAFLSYDFNPDHTGVIQQRFQSYKDALAENGAPFNPDLKFHDKEFDRLLQHRQDYSAIIASGDYLAAQLIQYLKNRYAYRRGDPAIIGFDNISFAYLMDPPLTTIHLDPALKGVLAFKKLLQISKKEDVQDQFTYLDGKLIVRES